MGETLFRRALADLRRWRPHVNLHHRGEPFLHPRIVEMIGEAAATGARVTLHTGAHVPLPAPAGCILAAGLSELVISLGAATAGRFAQLRPGVDREDVLRRARELLAAARGTPTRTIVEVFETDNAREELAAAGRLFAGVPPDEIRLRPIHNWAGTVHLWHPTERPASRAAEWRCVFPFYALVVLADGRVTACPQDFHARLVVGDLNRQTLAEVWKGEPLRRLRRRSGADLARQEPCAECLLPGGGSALPLGRLRAFVRRKVLAHGCSGGTLPQAPSRAEDSKGVLRGGTGEGLVR